ncbi:GntR family transcriptional regulator [Salinicola halophilus]|uniref:GntR family transcriptional regulator n=1 Tax=Salinicola halophilus TaxID=184065 RepID=UPI000DA1824E|nr:GntR family transcriptional regulator [Salinicola halophilus]
MVKIQQNTLYGEAAARIRDMINDGALLPGARVPEKQLCEQFGISRTPLREALKVLASEGMVELLPNRGARIMRLTRSTLEQTYSVMGALEGLSGELACCHITEQEIDAIQALHDRMLEHYRAGDIHAYFALNHQIHDAIMAASRNDVLRETHNSLSHRIQRVRYATTMSDEHWAQAVAEHEAMIHCLRQRDGERMGAILREHLRHKLNVAAASGVIDD